MKNLNQQLLRGSSKREPPEGRFRIEGKSHQSKAPRITLTLSNNLQLPSAGRVYRAAYWRLLEPVTTLANKGLQANPTLSTHESRVPVEAYSAEKRTPVTFDTWIGLALMLLANLAAYYLLWAKLTLAWLFSR